MQRFIDGTHVISNSVTGPCFSDQRRRHPSEQPGFGVRGRCGNWTRGVHPVQLGGSLNADRYSGIRAVRDSCRFAQPLIDTEIATTGYTYTACGSFVSDANLNNWQWRVRAYDAKAQFTDWSGWASFQFAPCRLSDGTPCHVPN
jgi:hypothetical protein